MRIEHSDIASIRVSDLSSGDVFQFDSSFYIVTNRPAADRNCIDLGTGITYSSAAIDRMAKPISHVPDATFMPHGRSSSES